MYVKTLNKTQTKIRDAHEEEMHRFIKLLENEGYVMSKYGPSYHYEKQGGVKDKLQITYSFKNSDGTRFFCLYKFKTGWALEIGKSCAYKNGACNFDKFYFTDDVYYAFLSDMSGGYDSFPKSSPEECLETFKANVDEAYDKVLNEVMSVEWTKGIGNHDWTYPSGEGTFYKNVTNNIL